jgi:glycerophosphoryl diester phosphodiesterase
MSAASARFAFLDHDGPLAIAHRGGAKEAPENTWTAFSRAVELGVGWMETDVHASADGVVVVMHDPVLDRVAGRPGAVSALPWSELGAVRLAGGEPIPRLDELLGAWPGVRWNIDAKHDAVVEPLAEVIRRAGALDRVCLTAFSDRRVARLRRLLGPRLCSATGPRAIAGLRVASLLPGLVPLTTSTKAPWTGAGATQVPPAWGVVPVVDRRYIAAAHRCGLAVHVWTVDEPAEMTRLLDLGVDGIMTDRPSVALALLAARRR